MSPADTTPSAAHASRQPAPLAEVEMAKSLARPEVRALREQLLQQSHVIQLTSFVHRLRETVGQGFMIPNFDPLDGGTEAEVLFLLEAPGPKAIASGFVSRDNPDESAKNFLLANAAAGIDRRRTVTWNIVPWYIGSGRKIRPACAEDIRPAVHWLRELLLLLPRLRFAVCVGVKARHAKDLIEAFRPEVQMLEMPHPSPMFVNRAPGNRAKLQRALSELSSRL